MNLGLGGRGVMGLGLGRSSVSAAAVPWWLAGGVAAGNAVAVYQPKGAASLAASYVNLANPGTYDAAPGVAPTFDAATGWTFNGATQYLTTGVVHSSSDMSLIIRFSGGSGNGQLFGTRNSTASSGLHIHPNFGGSIYFRNAGNYNQATPVASGVLAIAGKTAYINGSPVGTIDNSSVVVAVPIFIGAANNNGLEPINFYPCNTQAVAIYNTTLSAAQVAAVSAAMSSL